MIGLALRSLRYRAGGFVASFVALFLGTAIVMAFASLLETAAADEVSAASRETLVVMASVVGGWGLVIVTFAVVSTLSLSVRQREREMAVLKNVGATPAQIGRMIVGEAAVVAVVAGALAIPPAMLGGRLVLDLLVATDQVAPDVPHRFGGLTIGVGLGIGVVAAVLAAVLSARRTLRLRAT
ncbi:MAG: ABC transporter permease, partial [Chloroflexota bacterium]|nr:ABC transporter permease [Chloroflexota bacterium]